MHTTSSLSFKNLLSVSLVSYRSNIENLSETIKSLGQAACILQMPPSRGITLFLIENSSENQLSTLLKRSALQNSFTSFQSIKLVSGHGNVGYGRGHNLAINVCDSHYHLILNPDVEIQPDALVAAIDFMENHPEVGLLAPRILDEHRDLHYLCRRYPSALDLFIRGFLPKSWRPFFATRLARYEMVDVINTDTVFWNPPITSGCFMFFRTEILKRLKGFDPSYFLYFEDYDLSLRAGKIAQTVYVPGVSIVHFGGGASRKGLKHIGMFLMSAIRFFNMHGWKIW